MKSIARILIVLLLASLPVSAAELNNSGSGQWNEADSSNTSTSPDGWPVGLAPNQVRGVGQAMMGAIKRFWDRANPTVTTTGSANAYVYTPSNASFPTAYVAGECYAWKANFANTSAATLNVNGLGAKSLFKQTTAGPAALTGNEIQSGQHVVSCYDGTQLQIVSAIAVTGAQGGGYVEIQCQTASSSATLDFTTGIASTYDQYEFRLSNIVPATDATDFAIQVSKNAGGAWITSANYTVQKQGVNDAGTAFAGGSTGGSAIVPFTPISSSASGGITGNILWGNPAGTTNLKFFKGQLTLFSSDTHYYTLHFGGHYALDTNALNGVRFKFSAGNISTGRICLYGVALS